MNLLWSRNLMCTLVWVVSSVALLAQSHQELTQLDSINSIDAGNSAANNQKKYLEFYKLKSNRSIKFRKNQLIRLRLIKNGEPEMISARISEINDRSITFKLQNKDFDELTYGDSTLTYIEFATINSVLLGVVINTFLVATVVASMGVVLIAKLIVLLDSHSSSSRGLGINWTRFINQLPWNSFHRHIDVYNQPFVKKWGVRTI
jgi:hypothetical protein